MDEYVQFGGEEINIDIDYPSNVFLTKAWQKPQTTKAPATKTSATKAPVTKAPDDKSTR